MKTRIAEGYKKIKEYPYSEQLNKGVQKFKQLPQKKRRIVVSVLAGLLAVVFLIVLLSGKSDQIVYVQTVAEITGQADGLMAGNRYSGVVEAKNITRIKLEEGRKIKECFVEVGNEVSPGTKLFSYDTESLALTYDQTKIEYETKLSNIKTYESEVVRLKKQVNRARAKTKTELNVQLSTAQLNLKKETYEANQIKEKLDELENIMKDNVVRATTNGTVRSINPPSDTSIGTEDNAYMTIVSDKEYWIKGTVSEQTIYQLSLGYPITIRSRLDEDMTWTGTIIKINTENPETKENTYYFYDGSDSASKYAFYVQLDETTGLMMGQHVYIELGSNDNANESSILLPAFYVVDKGDSFYVFAKNKAGKIEKRKIHISGYDEESDSYTVASGLSLSDSIAFPDENVRAGMKAVPAGYAEEDLISDGVKELEEGMIESDMESFGETLE